MKVIGMEQRLLVWRKSSHSQAGSGDCVEIAAMGDVIAVRDSKDPEGPKLFVGRMAWRKVARAIAEGELDR
jgi:hypothetical protein